VSSLASLTAHGSYHARRPCACANQPCSAAPYVHIQLDVPGGPWAARHDAVACQRHMDEVLCGLVIWAHRHGLGSGQVTMTEIGP